MAGANGSPGQVAAIAGFPLPRLREHGYPRMAELMDSGPYQDDHTEDDVEFGPHRILDGIELLITEGV